MTTPASPSSTPGLHCGDEIMRCSFRLSGAWGRGVSEAGAYLGHCLPEEIGVRPCLTVLDIKCKTTLQGSF